MQNRRRKIRHRKNRSRNRWKIHRKNKIDKKSSTKVNKSCILSPAPLPGSGTGRAAEATHLRPPEVGASDRRSERTLRRTNFLTPFNRKSGSGTGTLAVLFLAFGHNRSEGSMSAKAPKHRSLKPSLGKSGILDCRFGHREMRVRCILS